MLDLTGTAEKEGILAVTTCVGSGFMKQRTAEYRISNRRMSKEGNTVYFIKSSRTIYGKTNGENEKAFKTNYWV